MKKTKYWQVPEVHFNMIQKTKQKTGEIPPKKIVRYSDIQPTIPYLFNKRG